MTTGLSAEQGLGRPRLHRPRLVVTRRPLRPGLWGYVLGAGGPSPSLALPASPAVTREPAVGSARVGLWSQAGPQGRDSRTVCPTPGVRRGPGVQMHTRRGAGVLRGSLFHKSWGRHRRPGSPAWSQHGRARASCGEWTLRGGAGSRPQNTPHTCPAGRGARRWACPAERAWAQGSGRGPP